MLDLVEYRPDVVTLARDEAAELTEMTKGAEDDDRPKVIERLALRKDGRWTIQPGPYVGRFRLGSGRVVTISSRFPFQDLAILLGLGERTILLHDDAAAAGGGLGLMDLIALAYARETERIVGQGLLKAYERREFTRPPYGGTPSAALHIRAHAGRPDRLATTANRLTSDVPLNRMAATALRRLCALPGVDDAVTVRLRAQLPAFRAIADLAGPPPAAAVVPPRYREVARLARLVLEGRTVLPTGAGVAGMSVLFSMTEIWERYVLTWLRRRWPDHEVRPQYAITLTDSGPPRPSAHADFVVRDLHRPVAVYDAKYKERKAIPRSSELYQLYTYARRLGVTRAGLVYPGVTEQQETATIGEVTIETYAAAVA